MGAAKALLFAGAQPDSGSELVDTQNVRRVRVSGSTTATTKARKAKVSPVRVSASSTPRKPEKVPTLKFKVQGNKAH